MCIYLFFKICKRSHALENNVQYVERYSITKEEEEEVQYTMCTYSHIETIFLLYSEICLNRTLNKLKSCIKRTLHKIPMSEIFVNLTCLFWTQKLFCLISNLGERFLHKDSNILTVNIFRLKKITLIADSICLTK